jgi:hypothetical protein
MDADACRSGIPAATGNDTGIIRSFKRVRTSYRSTTGMSHSASHIRYPSSVSISFWNFLVSSAALPRNEPKSAILGPRPERAGRYGSGATALRWCRIDEWEGEALSRQLSAIGQSVNTRVHLWLKLSVPLCLCGESPEVCYRDSSQARDDSFGDDGAGIAPMSWITYQLHPKHHGRVSLRSVLTSPVVGGDTVLEDGIPAPRFQRA